MIPDLRAAFAAVAPKAEAEHWLPALLPPMRSGGIVTARRVAMFLGQCAEESAGFTRLEENLSYTAERLCQVWPKEFPSLTSTVGYARIPVRLASRVYANRLGNGDEASGDGWTFRGAGLIQLTGRANYQACADALGHPLASFTAWVRTPFGATASAVWFWNQHRLNRLADEWGVTATTRAISGGTNGLPERLHLCNAALVALGGAP